MPDVELRMPATWKYELVWTTINKSCFLFKGTLRWRLGKTKSFDYSCSTAAKDHWNCSILARVQCGALITTVSTQETESPSRIVWMQAFGGQAYSHSTPVTAVESTWKDSHVHSAVIRSTLLSTCQQRLSREPRLYLLSVTGRHPLSWQGRVREWQCKHKVYITYSLKTQFENVQVSTHHFNISRTKELKHRRGNQRVDDKP